MLTFLQAKSRMIGLIPLYSAHLRSSIGGNAYMTIGIFPKKYERLSMRNIRDGFSGICSMRLQLKIQLNHAHLLDILEWILVSHRLS